MEWYEYIILIIAIGLFLLPFILSFVNKKKGKKTCSCGCSCCANRHECMKHAIKE